jgi:hypothetical protein
MNRDELHLFNSSKDGDVDRVNALLIATPTVNVNWRNPDEVVSGTRLLTCID